MRRHVRLTPDGEPEPALVHTPAPPPADASRCTMRRRGYAIIPLADLAICRGRRGFTLIELLIVIGTIALLMAILLPLLGNAREQARMVKCQSNLRQVLAAMLTYSDGNHGVLPVFDDAAQRLGY